MAGKLTVVWLVFGLAAMSPGQEPATQPNPPEPGWTFKIDLGLYSLSWSPDGQLLAVGGMGKIRVLRAPGFAVDRSLDTGQEEVWGLAWSPDGTLLASGGKDGTLQIWSGDTLQRKLFQGGWILDLAWNPDGASIMAVDYTGLAKEWNVQGYLRASIQLDGDGLGIDWSPRGRFFAVTTGQDGSRLLLFDEQSGELRWRRQDVLPGYKPPFGYGLDEVNGVSYSPTGKWLATAHQDGRIIVRSADSADRVFGLQLHPAGVGGARHVAWSPRGDWLASSGEDGRVYCVEYPKAKRRVLLLKSEKPVWSVAWSPDGKWIAAAGDEGRVWIWSTSDFLPAATPKKLAGNTEATPRSTASKSSPATNHRSHKRPSAVDWLRQHF
jgi:WD40 repeat protein